MIPRQARLPLVLLLTAVLVAAGPTLSAQSSPATGGPVRGLAAAPSLAAVATAVVSPVAASSAMVGGDADPRSRRGARGAAGNPLAGVRWGVYKGNAEHSWQPYQRSRGRQKALLGRIALRPKAKWFGRWIPQRDIAKKLRWYIDTTTGGDPDVLVPLTTYRVDPWQKEACHRLPTAQMKASYRRWIDTFARTLGNTRAQVVVQPDGPFQMCAPRGSKALKRLIAYQVRKLAALPRTTVYIEVGSAGWNHLRPQNVVRLLRGSGIGLARGFHMNVTHYEATGREVRFGARVVRALERAGFHGKHFTVDTAENGKPFTWRYNKRHHPGDFNHAPACRNRRQRHCVTLGIPPTADVGNPAWGLPARVRSLAVRYVDAYVWSGRPWLKMQTLPFMRHRSLKIARTTPFRSYPG